VESRGEAKESQYRGLSTSLRSGRDDKILGCVLSGRDDKILGTLCLVEMTGLGLIEPSRAVPF